MAGPAWVGRQVRPCPRIANPVARVSVSAADTQAAWQDLPCKSCATLGSRSLWDGSEAGSREQHGTVGAPMRFALGGGVRDGVGRELRRCALFSLCRNEEKGRPAPELELCAARQRNPTRPPIPRALGPSASADRVFDSIEYFILYQTHFTLL